MSVLIATPCYGGQVTEAYFRSCMTLRESLLVNEVHHDWLMLTNDSLVQRARNSLVSRFLKTDFERLFFIDADIEFTEHDFGKVYALDTDVGVGVYAMKDPKKARYAAWQDGRLVDDLDFYNYGIMEVDYAGTGFMCIKRQVFELMMSAFPERRHEDGVGESFAWFDPRVEDEIYLSEDYAFCKDIRSLGLKVVMDSSVRLKHHGTYAYG